MTLFEPAGSGGQAEPEQVATAAPQGPSFRVRLTVAYDGSGYRGFAVQRTVPTVGGMLTDALTKVLGHQVDITCAGRTDAGVHAWGQVVTFDAYGAEPAGSGGKVEPDLDALQTSLNKMLGPAIVVRDAGLAPIDFDARRSATARRYRYTVLNTPTADPFLAKTAWHVDTPLDLRAMQLGCDPLIGTHDFSSFCRQPTGKPPGPLVRRVVSAGWIDLEDGRLRFDIEANAFCHQMVRSVVGTLVDVGAGRKRAGDIAGILRATSRSAASQPAPPRGLSLHEVLY